MRSVAVAGMLGLGILGGTGLTAPQPPPPSTGQVKEFTIEAERYKFTPQTIEVMQGDQVRLVFVTKDVTHGVQIRKFKVKKLIPKDEPPVVIEFTATDAGTFPIICSEYCGGSHRDMKGALVVKARPAS
jgi:cytochrome c oxidase subunit 2